MNRFGQMLVALLVLAGVGIASMVRLVDRPAGAATVASPATTAPAAARPGRLTIPVAGVAAAALVDTFGQARGADRVHGAIDIMAARGTQVLAAAGGTIEKLFESRRGGHTLYIRSPDRTWSYYYAHLDHYADGVREGQYVAAGTPIAAVGSTGDANPDGPHLHFEVKRMAPGETWWKGIAIDPYPLLAGRVGTGTR